MKFLGIMSYLFLATGVCAGHTAAAHEQGDDRGDDRDEVLVLGDSVPFAYIASAGHEYINPTNFHGFADDLERRRRIEAVDAACPGETTGSFLSSGAPDNGCRTYRAHFPLHVSYASTQLAFAQKHLREHHDVRLITITLGANDGFLLQDACVSQTNPTVCFETGLPTLLATIEANMHTILAKLRAAGYGGAIIITNYYSTDYSDIAGTGLTALLNQAVSAPALAYGAVVADVFTAFRKVADNPLFGGKTCNAGLLNALASDQNLCDVHPSQAGHRLIAETIAHVFRTAD